MFKLQNRRIRLFPGTTTCNEADSNADTYYLGANFTILSCSNRIADIIYPCDDSYEPTRQGSILSGTTIYTRPNEKSYILIRNETLFIMVES